MQRIQLEVALEVLQRLDFHVRDVGLLDSALERPVTTAWGKFVYPSLPLAVAAQTESLSRHHALFDGNKRTALILLNAFLRVNGYKHVMDSETSYSLMMHIAQGEFSINKSASVIEKHLRTCE